MELFLVPMIGDGSPGSRYRPKYGSGQDHPEVVGASCLRYAMRDVGMVLIRAPQAYLDSVRSQPDAVSLATPANIDQALTAEQADTARTFFEARTIPAQWIDAGETRRQVIRGLAGMFRISVRLEGLFGEGFVQRAQRHGVTLSTKWQQLPQAFRNELRAIGADFGWDVDGLPLTGASELREVLRVMGDQFQGQPALFGGVSI